MSLEVNILLEKKLNYITSMYKEFNFLFDVNNIPSSSCFKWYRSENTVSYDIQVIFTGKTGYGKSSTLNSLLGKTIFKADDIASCTKDLYSAEFKCHDSLPYYFSLGDLPGIGESDKADEIYLKWYKKFISKAHCNVYFLRTDQRDYTIDHKECFDSIFNYESIRNKTVIALNCVDKIEPINRTTPFSLNNKQKENLNAKINNISDVFKIEKKQIIPISAVENYNLDKLMNTISSTVKNELKYIN